MLDIIYVIVFINFIVALGLLARGFIRVVFVSEKRIEGRRDFVYAAIGVPVLYGILQLVSTPA